MTLLPLADSQSSIFDVEPVFNVTAEAQATLQATLDVDLNAGLSIDDAAITIPSFDPPTGTFHFGKPRTSTRSDLA